MKKVIVIGLAVVSALGLARGDAIVIKGSDTLGAKLVPQLAEQFKSEHSGTTFDIAAGSYTAFTFGSQGRRFW